MRFAIYMYTGIFAIIPTVICALRPKILMHIMGGELDGLLCIVSDVSSGGY